MRSLKEIRNSNKRSDLLLVGMENEAKQLSPEQYKIGYKEYTEHVKPSADRVWNRQLRAKKN